MRIVLFLILLIPNFNLLAQNISYIIKINDLYLNEQLEYLSKHDVDNIITQELLNINIPNDWPIYDKSYSFNRLFNDKSFSNSDYISDSVHLGIDIIIDHNTPIISVEDGIIELIDYDASGLGIFIVIKHNDDLRTIYGHIHKTSCLENQYVRKGQIIAYSGNTGISTKSCLHYGILYKNIYIDPLYYLK